MQKKYDSDSPEKFITALGYDANDNVSKISDQGGALLYTNTYTFDGDNRPVKAKTSTTSDNLTYAAWGRLSRKRNATS